MKNRLSYRLKKTISYAGHSINSRRIGIHGIQSPFVYGFTTNITNNFWPYYAFDKIESLRKVQADNLSKLSINGNNNIIKGYAAEIELSNVAEIRIGQTLFRIVDYIRANNILEIGTFFGIDTLYLSEARKMSNCVSITENLEMADFSKNILDKTNIDNIKIMACNLNEALKNTFGNSKADFVLFNVFGDLSQKIDYFNCCLSVKHSGTVFVIKHIHCNSQMESFWNIVKDDIEVSASIDMFNMGILFFRKDLEKKNYIIRQKKFII